MKRGRGDRLDSDTFILESDARIQDLDRELEILRQKRQIIQEHMTQKPYGSPYMSEPPRQQWNQPFQQSQQLVQYPIMSHLQQFMNPQAMNQNTGQGFNQNALNTFQFNQNPTRREPNPPRLNINPPRRNQMRQKSPPRRPINPPRRPINAGPRQTYPINPPKRPNPPMRPSNTPMRPQNPPMRSQNPPMRPSNPPPHPPNPPHLMDTKKAKQRKRPRKPMEVAPISTFKSEPVNSTKSNFDSYKPGLIFRHNEEPSNQVMGRLELALGTILKQIKIEYTAPPHNVKFTPEGVKHLKFEIRKRVRDAMAGKYIKTIDDTMNEYRKMYPIATDKEMVDSMKKYQKSLTVTGEVKIKTVADETFRKHLKDNFKITLDEFVKDMFAKMKTLCKQEEDRTRSELEAVGETGRGDGIAASGPSQPTDANDQLGALADETQWQVDVDVPQAKPNIQQPNKVKDMCEPYLKLTRHMMARRLPEILGNHKEAIISLLDMDKLFDKLYERKQKKLLVEKKERLSQPLYVKILGQPMLPPKKDTVVFLKHFNIVSLKKHTKMTNMLVAALGTKQDFEAIMAANGIKLANCTLYIQRSTSKTDDSINFDENDAAKNTNGVDSPANDGTLKALDSQFDEQLDNLLASIRNDDDECTNAKKFKKGDGEAIDSNEVFGAPLDDSDTALVIDEGRDSETVTADSTNVDLSTDGLPMGFAVIDSVQDNSDDAPQDSQATIEAPVGTSYSDASTLEVGGDEGKGEKFEEAEIENNSDVCKNSSDVEILETIQDVITIDDEAEDPVSSEIIDVKPVVAAAISEPRRSSRNVAKN